MVTLMSVWVGGRLLGRCDEKCYGAEQANCDCVCAGRNHGKGLPEAAAITRQYADEMIAKFAESRDLTTFESAIQREPGHKNPLRPPTKSAPLPLFELA